METKRVKINKISENSKAVVFDSVVHEAQVTLEIGGSFYTHLYCLPTNLDELATGYSFSEGISPNKIEIAGEKIKFLGVKPGDNKPGKITSQKKIRKEEVIESIKALDKRGFLFKKTGGTHVVGICEGGSSIFVEDISRHCAIDKIIGLAIKNKFDLSSSNLVTSCRQTISTIRKAVKAQIPIVISISAPTDLAIKEAREFGVTLVGFCRNNEFNIYSHEWRISL